MPANNDKPSVGFNFDTFEGEAVQPFGVVLDGKRYEAINPLELDYRELEAASDNGAMIEILFPEDHKEILSKKLRVDALQAFSRKCMEHYGLDPTGA